MKQKKKSIPKVRNEFVAGMRFRKSGAHVKTKKAIRRAEKIALKKESFNKAA